MAVLSHCNQLPIKIVLNSAVEKQSFLLPPRTFHYAHAQVRPPVTPMR